MCSAQAAADELAEEDGPASAAAVAEEVVVVVLEEEAEAVVREEEEEEAATIPTWTDDSRPQANMSWGTELWVSLVSKNIYIPPMCMYI